MRARRRGSHALGGCLALALAASGCGSMHYSYHARGAARHLEQARQMDAEVRAPYEYEMARLHLDKAREEAGRAEYQDAVALSRISNEHAQKAIEVARERRQQLEDRESER